MSVNDGSRAGSSRSLDGDDGVNVSREEFHRLFSAISDVKGQISSMKRELTKERDEANDQLVKRLKLEKKTVFKRKGNERQYVFNAEVEDKVVAAASSLDATPPEVEKARNLLKEGEELIKERQKLIKVADRSEHGWATVEEYVADELADDSDDEKRLFKAEARAGRKLKASKFKGKRVKGKFPYAFAEKSPVASVYNGRPSAHFSTSSITSQQPAAGTAGELGLRKVSPPIGPCFQCGKLGHFRRSCPLLNPK